MLGTFISRFTTLLAKDGGNVGIGTTNPTESLDARGFVKGQAGLCIGEDCRTAQPPVSDIGIPTGYQEIYYNVGEDIYGAWDDGRIQMDTCNGSGGASYECKPEESRTCTDNNKTCTRGGCSGYGQRTITCKTSKILAQGEGFKKSTVGTATITQRDYSGSSEWCRVKIESPACNWEGRSSDSTEWNDAACELWVEGRAARICFANKGLYTFWNRSGDSGPIEIFYRP